MKNNKQVILGKDLWIFVGLNNEKKEFKIFKKDLKNKEKENNKKKNQEEYRTF